MNLITLLEIYNATQFALNGVESSVFNHDEDTLRLSNEVDETTIGGCPFDCCDVVFSSIFPKNCSNTSERYFACSDFVLRHNTLEKIVHAQNCAKATLASKLPHVFSSEGWYIDDLNCSDYKNENLYEVDDMIRASEMYNYLHGTYYEPTKKKRVKVIETNVLTSCFWPQTPPDRFYFSLVKRSQRIKREVFEKRKFFLENDIREILKDYSFNVESVEMSGSGVV